LKMDAFHAEAYSRGKIKPLSSAYASAFNLDAEDEALSNVVYKGATAYLQKFDKYNKKADEKLMVTHQKLAIRERLDTGTKVYFDKIWRAAEGNADDATKAIKLFGDFMEKREGLMEINVKEFENGNKTGYVGSLSDDFDKFKETLSNNGLRGLSDNLENLVKRNKETKTVNWDELEIIGDANDTARYGKAFRMRK
jgi:hypothetical protein